MVTVLNSGLVVATEYAQLQRSTLVDASRDGLTSRASLIAANNGTERSSSEAMYLSRKLACHTRNDAVPVTWPRLAEQAGRRVPRA
jgi:hypothetical protein